MASDPTETGLTGLLAPAHLVVAHRVVVRLAADETPARSGPMIVATSGDPRGRPDLPGHAATTHDR